MAKKQRANVKAKKTRGAKQTEIPGTERPTTPAIEEAAGELREVRKERMELQKAEVELQDKLVSVMKAEGVSIYRFNDGEEDLDVKLSDTKQKVSIKKVKAPLMPSKSEDE